MYIYIYISNLLIVIFIHIIFILLNYICTVEEIYFSKYIKDIILFVII